MTTEERQAHEHEAARLKLLPPNEQLAIVALHQSVADDAEVSKANRDEARRRVKALKRLLNLDFGKKKK
ncbi:MAG: hypothetical protein K8T89_22110 [Planctomycetes bacterium]|nr:hypothetical protein [Planctomycetota bacterium]